ncbi:MAG: HAMP domain-containing histidine kinase [Ruminococcus sp.]|nr:HAMP domain-containing histidine kinase [Ruminococcus sp.]
MNSSKSIFSRYFAICSAVILVSFVCLGTVLLLVSSRYFVDEKKSLMLKDAKALALYLQDEMLESPDSWRESAEAEFKNYAISSNADYALIASDGYVVLATSEIGESIDVSTLSSFGEEGNYLFSDLGGAIDKSHIMGLSFRANGPEYYVIAYSGRSVQDNYTQNIMEIFVISAVTVLIMVLFLVYFATLKLTEPIKVAAEVSKKLGEGDFSATMPEYNTTEFMQLSAAFNEMAANLKSYDTMRNSFLANVSHELRTPMTSIGGFVDGILDGTIPKSQHTYYMRVISSEVKRLTRLVRSMLNLAKIEAGEMDLTRRWFYATEPIVETLVTFEKRIEDKRIEIRGLEVERVRLWADIDLIHQVMYNLIENAIKFVDEGGYIEFSFNVASEGTAVTIRNSGEGLSEEELPLVFDRFYKTDKSRGIHAQGLGLGLNIVRSIVELHGGRIMVRSVKGSYTEFTFNIPSAGAPADTGDMNVIEGEEQER